MVSEAVILAGGLGTRMLPASLYSAKEALPLIDTPILNHLIWEEKRNWNLNHRLSRYIAIDQLIWILWPLNI